MDLIQTKLALEALELLTGNRYSPENLDSVDIVSMRGLATLKTVIDGCEYYISISRREESTPSEIEDDAEHDDEHYVEDEDFPGLPF